MQMTLDFEPGLSERHATLLDQVRECVYTNRSPMKTVAMSMDLSPSELTRKLNRDEKNPRSFSVDDLESLLAATGDFRPIFYLVEKYLKSDEQKQRAAVAQISQMAPALMALFKQAGLGQEA